MKKFIQISAMLVIATLTFGFRSARPAVVKSDYFLKIEGIKGTSKDADHLAWIPVKKISISKNAIRFFREPDKSSNKIAGFYNAPVQAKPAVFSAKNKEQTLQVTLLNWRMSDFFAQGADEEIELKFEKLEAVVKVNGEEKPVSAEELKAFFEKNFQ